MKEKHPIVKAFAQLIFFVGRLVLSLRYRVSLLNVDAIDKDRPVLFLPNHQAVVDPMLLVSFVYPHKNIVPVVTSTYYDLPIINRFFKKWGAVRVSDLGAGSRNVHVLKDITESAMLAFDAKRSLVIYPSGQIASQGYERIINKKSAFEIVKILPDDVQIVAVRIQGLWGSMWSKAWTGKSPDFVSSLCKGIAYTLVNLLFFNPKRKVSISFEDISQACRRKALNSDRKGFNTYLEGVYNVRGEEPAVFIKHCFFQRSGRTLSPKVERNPVSSSLSTLAKRSISTEMEERVRHIVAKKLELSLDEVQAESNLAHDLGADSLSMVEIVQDIEHIFQVELHSEIRDLHRVYDLCLLANGDLQKSSSLSLCTFGQNAPFEGSIKVDSTDHILAQFIRQFTRHQHQSFSYDSMLGETSRKDFLLKACVIAEIIKKKCRKKRVGIMLPALQSTSMLIVGCYLAGKIPVMLNWTVGRGMLEHCVKEAKVDQVFTASSFVNKIVDKLPASIIDKLVMMEKEVKDADVGVKLRGYIKSKLPKIWIDPDVCNEVAVILFTSGSETLPKAVPLTHANIIYDLKNTLDSVNLSQNHVLMGVLPPFHSFGFTVLSILPLVTGVRIAYYPDPTDGRGVVRAISHTSASLLVLAPSFLKNVLAHDYPGALDSVEYVVSGSEALGKDIQQSFARSLPKATLLEGYGITECSPVLALNPLDKQKEGSVGKVISGVKCRIIDLDSEKVLGTHRKGMICFRGKNIFNGYLNPDIENPFIVLEGESYYQTGDIGYLDDEGYLFITGRLKRFIKISGEMISLPWIEDVLLREFGDENERVLAVEGTDTCQPACIVLYTIKPLDIAQVNRCLKENNAPPIAKINKIQLLETIPVLGNGKVDYKVLKDSVLKCCS